MILRRSGRYPQESSFDSLLAINSSELKAESQKVAVLDLNQRELLQAREFCARFDLQSSLPQFAGLLTIPSLQANSIRIETAVHLSVASCRGKRRVSRKEISHLLNAELAGISYIDWDTQFDSSRRTVGLTRKCHSFNFICSNIGEIANNKTFLRDAKGYQRLRNTPVPV